MKSIKKLKNYIVTRTRIVTTKEVATTEKLGETEKAVKELLEKSYEFENPNTLSNGTRRVLSMEETLDIKEAN